MIDLEEIEAKRIPFLMEAAYYFRKRDTGGEDKTHWANVYNGDNCEKSADDLLACVDEITRLRALVEEMAAGLANASGYLNAAFHDGPTLRAVDSALAAYRAYKEQADGP